MRTSTGLGLLICCCAGLAACTAAAPKGPDATVTTPSVGRPPAPASAQAAMSREAFTPYAGLGASTDDGLAPGDTYSALHAACMDDAGYPQDADATPYFARANRGLAFAQPYGPWGYIGTALAAQSGFTAPPSSDDAQSSGSPGTLVAGLPAPAQAAGGKCFNIIEAFNNAQFATSLAGIETMNNDISNDVVQDLDFKQATKAWSACMAKNGYTAPDADTLMLQELDALGLRVAPGSETPGSGPTAAQNEAQIATAVTDANCTLSADLAGIYFAVQGSYEQQFVTANQQALTAAVRQYKAAYAKELGKLPALLRTTSATPDLPDLPGPSRPGGPAHAAKPSPGKPSPGKPSNTHS
jgi:hypothetical protein